MPSSASCRGVCLFRRWSAPGFCATFNGFPLTRMKSPVNAPRFARSNHSAAETHQNHIIKRICHIHIIRVREKLSARLKTCDECVRAGVGSDGPLQRACVVLLVALVFSVCLHVHLSSVTAFPRPAKRFSLHTRAT